jgi:hypothetical protein
MKFHNKQKRYRLAEWTKISTVDIPFTKAKRWCQQHGSTGKFFTDRHDTSVWWFEVSEDALAFKLVWNNSGRV